MIRCLDAERYEPIPIGISNDGKWYYFTGNLEKIKQDSWRNPEDCIPAALSPDRNAHKLLLFQNDRVKSLHIDAAFPVMHGKYGEDGTIQGLIELAGIPLVGYGVLASALCMDKDRAHTLAHLAGVATPKALVLEQQDDLQSVSAFSKKIGFPLFVKPVKAGSSYGVTYRL